MKVIIITENNSLFYITIFFLIKLISLSFPIPPYFFMPILSLKKNNNTEVVQKVGSLFIPLLTITSIIISQNLSI